MRIGRQQWSKYSRYYQKDNQYQTDYRKFAAKKTPASRGGIHFGLVRFQSFPPAQLYWLPYSAFTHSLTVPNAGINPAVGNIKYQV